MSSTERANNVHHSGMREQTRPPARVTKLISKGCLDNEFVKMKICLNQALAITTLQLLGFL
eukprot:2149456-Amphidinium_carterae.1